MKNLISVHLVTAEDFLKPQLEGFLDSNLPLIHSRKHLRVYRKHKEVSIKIKKANVRGMLKLALSVVYFMALVYFLTVILL